MCARRCMVDMAIVNALPYYAYFTRKLAYLEFSNFMLIGRLHHCRHSQSCSYSYGLTQPSSPAKLRFNRQAP